MTYEANTTCTDVEDDWCGALRGLELCHDLHLSLASWSAWDEVARRCTAAGGELVSLVLTRQGARIAARCRVRRIAPAAARELLQAVLTDGLAEAGNVEHLMLAR